MCAGFRVDASSMGTREVETACQGFDHGGSAMEDVDYNTRTRDPDQPGTARQVAGQAADAAGTAAGEVAGTAKEQAREVAGEVKAQARGLAEEVRDRVGTQARSQNDRLADG